MSRLSVGPGPDGTRRSGVGWLARRVALSAACRFDLIGVGWTFFWGVEGRLNCEQEVLLRSGIRYPTQRTRGTVAGALPQPHWHLDTGMMASYSRPILREGPIIEPTELEELLVSTQPELEEIGEIVGLQELDLLLACTWEWAVGKTTTSTLAAGR